MNVKQNSNREKIQLKKKITTKKINKGEKVWQSYTVKRLDNGM